MDLAVEVGEGTIITHFIKAEARPNHRAIGGNRRQSLKVKIPIHVFTAAAVVAHVKLAAIAVLRRVLLLHKVGDNIIQRATGKENEGGVDGYRERTVSIVDPVFAGCTSQKISALDGLKRTMNATWPSILTKTPSSSIIYGAGIM